MNIMTEAGNGRPCLEVAAPGNGGPSPIIYEQY